MYYIYAYCDPRDKKVYNYKNFTFPCKPFYIGKGKGRRFKQHLQNCILKNNSTKSNTILKIREQGLEPIVIKVFTDLDENTAYKYEKDIINYFGRKNNGTGILTNFTDGGEGFSGFIITEETRKKMSLKAIGTKTYANNGQSKIVAQINLEDEVINIYSCLREAGEKTGISFKTISTCCRGITKTAGGYKWEYLGKSYNPPIKKEKSSRCKKVYQYDLKGNFIREWDSQVEVRKILNILHISAVCLGKLNIAGGYQWSYIKHERLYNLVENEKRSNVKRYINEEN